MAQDTARQVGIRLALFADLRKHLPKGHEGPIDVAVPDGAPVAAVLAAAGIPAGGEITVAVNGELGSLATLLHAGDQVTLFTPMEGG
jgi:molybdopterin converting factor small subunit